MVVKGPDGEIGRRSGLKIRGPERLWEFKSPSGHQLNEPSLQQILFSLNHLPSRGCYMGYIWLFEDVIHRLHSVLLS